jgi:hypothetical protein
VLLGSAGGGFARDASCAGARHRATGRQSGSGARGAVRSRTRAFSPRGENKIISWTSPITEDLIILKAVAHRPKDLLDIQGIAANHPGLDRGRVEHWVREFAGVLEMPELWEDVARLL